MRILHIIQRYWPAGGGAEVHLGEISAYVAAQGHHVTVATTDALDFERFWDPRRRRIEEPADEKDGVQVRRFPIQHLPGGVVTYSAIRRFLWIASMVRPVPIEVMARLARFTPRVPDLWHWLASTNEEFDLVAGMTICFEPLLDAGLRFARKSGIPFVLYPLTHLGAGEAPASDALSRFYTMRHQVDLVRRSHAVVAQTTSERDFYVSRGVRAENIEIVGPGVTPASVLGGDGARFRQNHAIANDVPIVFSVSSMSYDKGTVTLIEAVRRLWREGHVLELVLAGSILEPFRRYLETLPSHDRQRIRILGRIPEEEKRDLFAAGDIFAMPSRTDSFGIVYLEAWLYRKPVIGAQTWGVNDVITEGVDGCLVPFDDASALAEKIIYLLRTPDVRAQMGISGEQKVYQSHTWAHKNDQVYALYCRLADVK